MQEDIKQLQTVYELMAAQLQLSEAERLQFSSDCMLDLVLRTVDALPVLTEVASLQAELRAPEFSELHIDDRIEKVVIILSNAPAAELEPVIAAEFSAQISGLLSQFIAQKLLSTGGAAQLLDRYLDFASGLDRIQSPAGSSPEQTLQQLAH